MQKIKNLFYYTLASVSLYSTGCDRLDKLYLSSVDKEILLPPRNHLRSSTNHNLAITNFGEITLKNDERWMNSTPPSILATDMDGDGRIDLIIANSHGIVYVLENKIPQKINTNYSLNKR